MTLPLSRKTATASQAGEYVSLDPRLTAVEAILDAVHEVWVNGGNGRGSTNTAIRRFTNIQTNLGTAITYADSVTLGGSWTINENGLYAISYTEGGPSNNAAMGISRNTTQPTTQVQTPANGVLEFIENWSNGFSIHISIPCTYLAAGDVIRAHVGSPTGYPDDTSTSTSFRIAQLRKLA